MSEITCITMEQVDAAIDLIIKRRVYTINRAITVSEILERIEDHFYIAYAVIPTDKYIFGMMVKNAMRKVGFVQADGHCNIATSDIARLETLSRYYISESLVVTQALQVFISRCFHCLVYGSELPEGFIGVDRDGILCLTAYWNDRVFTLRNYNGKYKFTEQFN